MRAAVSILALCALPVAAEPRGPASSSMSGSCTLPDIIQITDIGQGIAEVEYYNSAESCSRGFNEVLISKNGIAARVIITINDDPTYAKETIVVLPQDPGFMAMPPKAHVADGERVRIMVSGGMS